MHRSWVFYFQNLAKFFGEFQPSVDDPTVDNFASLDADGNVQDSGFDSNSFALKQHNHTSLSEGGQIDHGLGLTGLLDDDHTQYLLLAGRGGQQINDSLSISGAIDIGASYSVLSSVGQTTTVFLSTASAIRFNGGIVVEVM